MATAPIDYVNRSGQLKAEPRTNRVWVGFGLFEERTTLPKTNPTFLENLMSWVWAGYRMIGSWPNHQITCLNPEKGQKFLHCQQCGLGWFV
jgi:hypothetical protein